MANSFVSGKNKRLREIAWAEKLWPTGDIIQGSFGPEERSGVGNAVKRPRVWAQHELKRSASLKLCKHLTTMADRS